MHSIRGYLLSKRVELRDVPILHAVWFTGVRARATLPDSPEWHSWQVLDSSGSSPVVWCHSGCSLWWVEGQAVR